MSDDKSGDGRAAPGAPTHPGEAHATTQPGGVASPTQDTVVPRPSHASFSPPLTLPAPGYQLGEVIGRGGMGEVIAAHDQRIGREVAIKRMRTATPDGQQLSRFLREARIQARLDHPAIVPVHELGTDDAGRPFFTMKRVSGRTLGQRMTEGATQQELLRALVDVCLAVELAHSRGVVHRDLKPANIMLGDYGEVYVLDWGVARVLSDRHVDQPADIDTLDEGTQTGALLGTPGYMSPEQIKGRAATPPADVYALGAILFEILADEPLHPRGSAAIASTLTCPQDAPARRRADRGVSPELDGVCLGALAEEPEDRPTARQLADRIQAYLDGDRDVERRRAIASEQLAMARDALADGGVDARATAIRRAGRALALDPASVEAAELVSSLIVAPPKTLPPALLEQLAADDRHATSERSRAGFYAYLSLFGFFLWLPFVGIKDWTWLVVLFSAICVLAAHTWRAMKLGTYDARFGLVAHLILAILFTRIAGLFIVTPTVLCAVLLSMTTTQWVIQRWWIVIVWTTAAFLIPAGLEHAGLMMESWDVAYEHIINRSTIFGMDGAIADISLFVVNIVFVSIVGLVGIRVHRSAKEAKRRLAIQAWHLNHLVPR